MCLPETAAPNEAFFCESKAQLRAQHWQVDNTVMFSHLSLEKSSTGDTERGRAGTKHAKEENSGEMGKSTFNSCCHTRFERLSDRHQWTLVYLFPDILLAKVQMSQVLWLFLRIRTSNRKAVSTVQECRDTCRKSKLPPMWLRVGTAVSRSVFQNIKHRESGEPSMALTST